MTTPADPELARRLRIARLLMVTACDWGLATPLRPPLVTPPTRGAPSATSCQATPLTWTRRPRGRAVHPNLPLPSARHPIPALSGFAI